MSLWWIKNLQEHNLYETEIICNNVKPFTSHLIVLMHLCGILKLLNNNVDIKNAHADSIKETLDTKWKWVIDGHWMGEEEKK